jgi:hypothetical protein
MFDDPAGPKRVDPAGRHEPGTPVEPLRPFVVGAGPHLQTGVAQRTEPVQQQAAQAVALGAGMDEEHGDVTQPGDPRAVRLPAGLGQQHATYASAGDRDDHDRAGLGELGPYAVDARGTGRPATGDVGRTPHLDGRVMI